MNGVLHSGPWPRHAKRRFHRRRWLGASVVAVLVAGGLSPIALAQSADEASEPDSAPQVALSDLKDLLNSVLAGTALPHSGGPVPGAGTTPNPEPDPIPEPSQVSANETGFLDVHVREMDIATALEMLSYEARANIVTSTSVGGTVSANLYGVTLDQALEAILTPSQFTYARSGNTVFVGRPEELVALMPPPVTRVFRLKYIRPAEAAAAVRAILGQEANIVEGGAEDDESGGGQGRSPTEMGPVGVDYLIVTAQPAAMAQVESLLNEIDRRPKQVLIEATVLRATLNESNEFGIDFTFLGGVDFENVGSISNASSNLQTGLLPSEDLQRTTFNINTDFAGNVGDGGFTFGLITNNIASFIRALEAITDVTVVANPKVVALNKQPGEVIVGRRDGYLTTTVTETAAVQTVEFLETGTQIRFRPVINDDGTIRMSVHPKDSNGGLTDAQLPFEETTEAHADILVNDGDTVLIGGLFRERTTRSRSQIPVLGDIPWAGLLFGSTSDQTLREEVIILLTVHVIKESEAEQEHYEDLLDDVERVRVGARKGLLGTGRERLAQAYYHEALKNLEEGKVGAALLNVRLALHNQPRHLASIKLKEQLVGRRMWDDEGSRMRNFALKLIDAERPTSDMSRFGRPEIPSIADGDAEQ
jgi:type IV pilus assembly protein PilQ